MGPSYRRLRYVSNYAHGSVHGSAHGSAHGSYGDLTWDDSCTILSIVSHGSVHYSAHGSAHGSYALQLMDIYLFSETPEVKLVKYTGAQIEAMIEQLPEVPYGEILLLEMAEPQGADVGEKQAKRAKKDKGATGKPPQEKTQQKRGRRRSRNEPGASKYY